MKFEIANEHLTFFEKHRHVELASFMSKEKLQNLKLAIEQAIAKEVNIPPGAFEKLSTTKQFAAGHDLWRKDPTIRKFVLNPSLGAIAAQLIDQKTIRLGYDQYL